MSRCDALACPGAPTYSCGAWVGPKAKNAIRSTDSASAITASPALLILLLNDAMGPPQGFWVWSCFSCYFFYFHLPFTKAAQTAEFFMKQIISLYTRKWHSNTSICLLVLTTLIAILLKEYLQKNDFFRLFVALKMHIFIRELWRGPYRYTS